MKSVNFHEGDENMKEFQFLERHRYFEKMYESSGNYIYDFQIIKENYIEIGSIMIPNNAVGYFAWYFQEFNKRTCEKMLHLDTREHNLKDLNELDDNWFYYLVKEASVSLEKRDKLRRLFVK